jgi:replicative DNA helicase
VGVMNDVSPHTIEAERAVLGAVLVNPTRLDDVVDVVVEGDFYRDAHQRIFRTMLALSQDQVEIDTLTLSERLKREKALEEIGGRAYLMGLTDGVPRSSNAKAYAEHVKSASNLRQLERVGTRILALAREHTDDAMDALAQAEKLMFDLSQRRRAPEFHDGETLAQHAYTLVEHLLETKRHITGIASGFDDFDAMTKGLQPGNLVLLAARPSMGKTSFALNLAFNAAERGEHTAFFSLEMSEDEVLTRLIASVSRLDSHRLQSGRINQTDYTRIGDAIQRLAASQIHVLDCPGVSLMDVRGQARRLKARRGLGLVVVDYLQLMQLPRAENRNVAVSDVSRGLKLLARELNVPMVVLSQLSRDTEKRGGEKKPMLSDLRDSGALEQDADVVVFIHRPEVYDPKPDNAGLAELIIAKQRNGPTGTVKMSWHREQTRFDAWSGR